ncbi:probable pectinesterase/pectinesterase inhibitor 34 [Aristolochia californica]|uniref:probable pectinesterase/pectinesterase inhibitor 34 n=1 Tax=Aristolochia californica TaxID=171875 RepID=UPI0035DE6AEF
MDYDRLGPSEHDGRILIPHTNTPAPDQRCRKRKLLLLLTVLSVILLSVSAVSAVLVIRSKGRGTVGSESIIKKKPTQAISRTCRRTRYPSLCINSLVQFPGAIKAGERDLVHISVNMTFQRVSHALYGASAIANLEMGTMARTAYNDCLELLEDSMDQLGQSLVTVTGSGGGGSGEDVLTWLSAALTNQDTCTEGLADVRGQVKNEMERELQYLTEMMSNCLAIFARSISDKDFSGVPIQNRRRLLSGIPTDESGFPSWISKRDRRLLQIPVPALRADITVSKDGNGTYKTIAEAIKAAPEKSTRRIVIYIKAGRYDENLKVGRKKTNLMFYGDGKGKTIIAGGRNIFQNFTTFHTATFAATGAGFILRDVTVENWAGPDNHQAVALRIGADHAVVYKCNIIGYQDTLYVHSQRQFFRECDVYGTVDFIFGNAAVVFQNCNLYARKPMPMQKNTVTAQNRKDPNQNTGISLHNCRILATPDLQASKASVATYLGRPWKLYSRVVYMLSYMGDHIHPAGWLEWNSTFALDTLYYGEYMNYGPGGAVGQRVKWPGYRVITAPEEASRFTVSKFIYGSSWLPSTGVAFMAGLSL